LTPSFVRIVQENLFEQIIGKGIIEQDIPNKGFVGWRTFTGAWPGNKRNAGIYRQYKHSEYSSEKNGWVAGRGIQRHSLFRADIFYYIGENLGVIHFFFIYNIHNHIFTIDH